MENVPVRVNNTSGSSAGSGSGDFHQGSISVSMSIRQTTFCFVCCHLTSGEKDGYLTKRNADVEEILWKTVFNPVHRVSMPKGIRDHKNLLGEDLGPLSMKELEQLENQIEISLKHIRSAKNQQSLDQLFELKRKEQQPQDVNKDLRRKIQETSAENVLHTSCQDVGPSGSSGRANQADQELLHPAVCDPSLHIGYHQAYLDHLNNE